MLQANEISLDLLEYFLSFSFAELFSQPLFRFLVAFGIVASILSMTQWHYILRYCPRAVMRSKWYPMIGNDHMPQSGRLTTGSAATIEVIKCVLPVSRRQRIKQLLFSGFAALFYKTAKPILIVFANSISVLFAHFILMIFCVLTRVCPMALSVVGSPVSRFYSATCFAIGTIITIFFQREFIQKLPFFADCALLFTINNRGLVTRFLPLLTWSWLGRSAKAITPLTIRNQIVFPASSVEEIRSCRKFLTARSTTFSRGIHSTFTSCCSPFGWHQAAVKTAFRELP